MRGVGVLLLLLLFILTSCQTPADSSTSFFRRTTWWERRMDRLETWDRHHQYPIEKTKETLVSATGCTILVTGAALFGLAYCTGAVAYFLADNADAWTSDSPPHKNKSK